MGLVNERYLQMSRADNDESFSYSGSGGIGGDHGRGRGRHSGRHSSRHSGRHSSEVLAATKEISHWHFMLQSHQFSLYRKTQSFTFLSLWHGMVWYGMAYGGWWRFVAVCD